MVRYLKQEWQAIDGIVQVLADNANHRRFLDVALPALYELALPLAVIVTAGFCGRCSEWLSWSKLPATANAGIELQAHSVDHRGLTMLSSEQVVREPHDSEIVIEDHPGVAVEAFAYPLGRLNCRVRRLSMDACRLRDSFGGAFRSCVVGRVLVQVDHTPWWPIA